MPFNKLKNPAGIIHNMLFDLNGHIQSETKLGQSTLHVWNVSNKTLITQTWEDGSVYTYAMLNPDNSIVEEIDAIQKYVNKN